MKPLFKTFFSACLLLTGASATGEEITERDRFWDERLERVVYVCGRDGETLMVGETCGKYWDKYPRRRQDLIKQIAEYKDIKLYDNVMIQVKKNGELKWILASATTIYEDGHIETCEYYTNPGWTPGSKIRLIHHKDLITHDPNSPLAKLSVVCAKENFEVNYGPAHDKVYKIDKGEKLNVKNVFSNGFISVSFQGFMKNIFSYGMKNKLPIPQDKVENCPEENAHFINDTPRMLKPVSDDGAGTSKPSGSKTKEK